MDGIYFIFKKLSFKKVESSKDILQYFELITEPDDNGLKLFSDKKYTGTVKKEMISLKYAREYPIAYGVLCVLNIFLVDKTDYTQIEIKVKVNIVSLLFFAFCTSGFTYNIYSDGTSFLIVFLLTMLVFFLTYLLVMGIIKTTISKVKKDMDYFEDAPTTLMS